MTHDVDCGTACGDLSIDLPSCCQPFNWLDFFFFFSIGWSSPLPVLNRSQLRLSHNRLNLTMVGGGKTGQGVCVCVYVRGGWMRPHATCAYVYVRARWGCLTGCVLEQVRLVDVALLCRASWERCYWMAGGLPVAMGRRQQAEGCRCRL